MARRERLLDATASLVARRGFHAVGIAEIGAAAGVTGSAIYRHFPNKTQLLVALFERVVDGLLDGVDDALGDDDPLDALVRAHVELALRDRAVIAVYAQEAHNLPADDRRRLRRKQRAYVERWVDALQRCRPELDRDDARIRVQATFGLLNSAADFPATPAGEALGPLLAGMAKAALTSS